MELTDQELEELEGYYHQTLLPENMQKITENMQKDSAYAKDASSFLNTLSMLEAGKYRTQAQYLMAESPSNLRVSWFKRPWAAIAAAAAVLLIVVGVWWMRQDGETKSNQLADYAQSVFVPPLSINRIMQISNDAAAAYDNGDYKTAIPLLKKAYETTQDELNRFYLSMCYIAESRPEEAIAILQEMHRNKTGKAKDPAWYLALAYMMQGKGDAALPYLEESAQSSDPVISQKSKQTIQFINEQIKN